MEERPRSAAEAIGLTADDYTRLTGLYDGRLAEHGVSVKTVGWGSVSDQHMRFEVLCRNLDLKGLRILDIGCGLGDFVPWAEEKYGTDFHYTGIDLSADLVKAAALRFGGKSNRKFIATTLAPNTDIGEFDVAVLSGTLTFKTADNLATMRSVLSSAWQCSRVAVCSNFMTSYADSQLEKNFHYSPEAVFGFAKSLSRHVTLHHDYDLYEFTVQVFREPTLKRALRP
jgi:SAM-dependent methyltransferase